MVEKLKRFYKSNFPNSPKAKMTLLIAICFVVVAVAVVSMRKTVTLSIDGKEETFVTYKGTVKDVLQDKGVEIGDKDKVQPSLESVIEKSEEISVKRAVPINVKFANKDIKLLSAEKTIGDALISEDETLKAQGVEFNKDIDEVTPSVDEPIEKDMTVEVVDVEVKNLKETQSIPFDTVVKNDSSLEKGKKQTKTEGKNGEKEVTYQVVYKNGQLESRKEISAKTLSAPVNAVVAHGTKSPTVYIPNRGGNVEYKKHIIVESTAYTGGTLTATGSKPVYNPGGIGTIAVDPRVIPLGSLVYVEGYGYAKAADTGGAIKGNIIDVYLSSEAQCEQWGRKYGVDTYVVAYPGQW